MLLAVQSVFLSLSLSFFFSTVCFCFFNTPLSVTHLFHWEVVYSCSDVDVLPRVRAKTRDRKKKNPLKLLCNQMLWWSEHDACAIVFLPANLTAAGYKFPAGKNNEHRQRCLETQPGETFVRLQQQDNPATVNIAASSDSWGQAPREQHEIHKQDVLMSFHFSET